MKLNDPVYDGQTEAATGFTRLMPVATDAVKPLKNFLVLLLGNSRTRVFHFQNHPPFNLINIHIDQPVSGSVFIGIAQQVE